MISQSVIEHVEQYNIDEQINIVSEHIILNPQIIASGAIQGIDPMVVKDLVRSSTAMVA